MSDNLTANAVFLSKFDTQVKSLVFPRNQENFLNCLPDLGIQSYRATEAGDSPESNTHRGNTLFEKVRRVSAGINPCVVTSTAFYPAFSRASLFLRLNLPVALWRLHLAKIKTELRNLSDGECLHIWCHPHNLGTNTAAKLKRVNEVLDLITPHRESGDLKILSMNEIHNIATAQQTCL